MASSLIPPRDRVRLESPITFVLALVMLLILAYYTVPRTSRFCRLSRPQGGLERGSGRDEEVPIEVRDVGEILWGMCSTKRYFYAVLAHGALLRAVMSVLFVVIGRMHYTTTIHATR